MSVKLSHGSDIESIRACVEQRCLLVPKQATVLLAALAAQAARADAAEQKCSDYEDALSCIVEQIQDMRLINNGEVEIVLSIARDALAATGEAEPRAEIVKCPTCFGYSNTVGGQIRHDKDCPSEAEPRAGQPPQTEYDIPLASIEGVDDELLAWLASDDDQPAPPTARDDAGGWGDGE
jgi:hypothetical protein